ncbi:hypothetical protein [Frondihabitans sucicola]|uniref:hypothetical protein n=1 Tax=Frondihabitans sucicola TaxID=1268041 RepID=UPI0025733958|nr:hypothetical protein [Frondihabitans sucicola]
MLDIDLVRSMLGGWRDDPLSAGLVARELALAMIRTHLGSGRDVVVPQYLSRPGFAETLEATAGSRGARFVEVVLRTDAAAAERRFAERAADAANADGADGADIHGPFVGSSMGDVVEGHAAYVDGRPRAIVVAPAPGEEFVSVSALEAVLSRRSG